MGGLVSNWYFPKDMSCCVSLLCNVGFDSSWVPMYSLLVASLAVMSGFGQSVSCQSWRHSVSLGHARVGNP